jgi:serine/threonine protein kinase
MAPEQAAGNQRQVGPAVDVYALGAILYECLTGRPPFQAATPVETLLQVMHHEPVSIGSLQPRVPRDLATIAMRCLEKTPARRYARALDLAEDLRRFQAPKEQGFLWERCLRSFLREFRGIGRALPLPSIGSRLLEDG